MKKVRKYFCNGILKPEPLGNSRSLWNGGSGQIFDLTGGKSLDEWQEQDHPRKQNGQFGKGNNNINKTTKCDIIGNKQRKEIQLSHEEYAKVMHELNTNLPKELKNKKIFKRTIGNFTYKVQNNGFNEYKIIGKQNIDDLYN